jgi:ribosomal protein S18 acetylase RimI-like enzyme
MTITRRSAAAGDEPFIEKLLKATLADELMASAWPGQMRAKLLDMQYRARRQSAVAQYPNTGVEIVAADGEDVGWLVVARTQDAIHLVDIAILPECRGAGTGSALLRGLVEESEQSRRPIRLHVLLTNRARHLYDRFGFVRIGGDEINDLMERRPA